VTALSARPQKGAASLEQDRKCSGRLRADRAPALAEIQSTIRLMESDSELVARLRDGDELAFIVLVRQYQMPMLRLARSMVNNEAVAEEAVQDTWMSVVKGIERFEARSSLKTWLFRILVNRVRSAHSGEQRRAPHRAPSVDPSFFDSSGQWVQPVVPWDEDIDDRLLADSIAPALRTALDRLPSRQREVVFLRDVEGLSSEEASEVLGLRRGNQRVLLHRGRAGLRGMLTAQMGRA
jgi:RNA polymerase sigma-70 factor (ECF subfamily)